MKTNVWSYLAQFLLKWEIFQTRLVEKIKTYILYSINFFSENLAIYEITWKNLVQSDRPQTGVRRMRFACWITRATNTHSEYEIIMLFHCNNGCTNAPHCYVIRTLSVLFVPVTVNSNRYVTYRATTKPVRLRGRVWIFQQGNTQWHYRPLPAPYLNKANYSM